MRKTKLKPSAEELKLVAEGKLRLPEAEISLRDLLRIPTGRVRGNKAVEALLADRNEGR
jgi:hypothetical protein